MTKSSNIPLNWTMHRKTMKRLSPCQNKKLKRQPLKQDRTTHWTQQLLSATPMFGSKINSVKLCQVIVKEQVVLTGGVQIIHPAFSYMGVCLVSGRVPAEFSHNLWSCYNKRLYFQNFFEQGFWTILNRSRVQRTEIEFHLHGFTHFFNF